MTKYSDSIKVARQEEANPEYMKVKPLIIKDLLD
jgi:hypothetical protein